MGSCFSSHLDEQHSFQPEKLKIGDETEASLVISKEDEDPRHNNLDKDPGYRNLDSFTYNEMRMATWLFRKNQVIGEGGFGVVYKGIIDDSVRAGYPRTEVAVKVLNPEGRQGEKEWLTEVNYLAHLQHPNLVKLIGYCCKQKHRLLVYEYMAAGSLEDHLFDNSEKGLNHVLPWGKRMKIALDAAKGLAFLHSAKRPVIFRDFKSSNILLDENFNAKLSDFGIAKDGPVGKHTHVSTRVIGTHGYTAPEYAATGHLRASCDVYAFGVVLIELLMGLRAVDKNRPTYQRALTEWARPLLLQKRKLLAVVDPRMDKNYSSKHVLRVANLAHLCIHQSPPMRPLMSQIVETLELVQTSEASN